ncbi:MAG TPA: carboxypeptidase regulatory-like domain-containing protein [Pyrinomonadaceae bacterium]|jgi:outer membrane receptor protein involved in Fe transport
MLHIISHASASFIKRCGLPLLLLLIIAQGAWAQTQITTGVIQGTVTDEAGALVPGASVEVKSLDTNQARTIQTDDDGRFVFLQLSPGRYSLTAAKQGFATLVQEDFTLTVGQAISLNLTMKVSQVEERVTITAIPTIDTVKTESSTTLNEASVSNLPVLGRKFEDLLTLTPGVSIVQGPDGDEITFTGQRGIFNNVSLDGGDYNNGFFGEQAGGQRAAIDIPLDAVQEFQVVATGATAEFGRTAGGVINVITKSGGNEFHGSLFHFQRLEALTANTSDGKPLQDFHREQFGGTIGGPIKRDKVFFFGAVENIFENLTRTNLSEPIGDSPCGVQTPTILANEALINSNADCQRLALLNFFRTSRNQEEGLPTKRPVRNSALLGKIDWNITPANKLSTSYNFDHSRNENQTFDVTTYGNSANGIEGPSKIQVLNLNLFSSVSATKVNEAHFTYARENRPRSAVESNVPADTAMGFGTTFRFGNPFFIQPNVDEVFWRTQLRDTFSIVAGKHTVKFGGEWIHSRNSQVFRGFFTGRYIFDSVAGFLRYASPASLGAGFGPRTKGCSNGSYVDVLSPCPAGTTETGGPLLLYLQDAPTGNSDIPPGFSDIKNEDLALFAQDSWHALPNLTLNYGLRWEAQIFPDPVTPPSETAYGRFLNDPRFPSDGTLHDQKKMFQPRVGFAWDIRNNAKSVLRANFGIYNARQNMLTQVGSITTNGVQQQTIFRNTGLIGLLLGFGIPEPAVAPTWPGLVAPPVLPAGTFNDFTGVRVFSRDYANPRIYTGNVAFEQELFPDWAMYLDFTWSKGVHLTRFVNINVGSLPVVVPTDGNTVVYTGAAPFAPQLGDVFVASSSAKSLYRGVTVGVRKRFSHGFQLEGNYVFAKDLDDDSNERDPFTDRSFNRFDFSRDYSLSDRDIRHRFNFYTNANLFAGLQGNFRIQARTAQPITTNPLGDGSGAPCSENNSRTRVVAGIDCGRNHLRKNNEFFSFDWRLQRPFRWGERYALVPIFEMFNTFNNANNVNPLITPGLFNFDGFLRQGVGDPRQIQLALRFTF